MKIVVSVYDWLVKLPSLLFLPCLWTWAQLAHDHFVPSPRVLIRGCVSPAQLRYALFCFIFKHVVCMYVSTCEYRCTCSYMGLTLMQDVFSCSLLSFWRHGFSVEPRAGWSTTIVNQLAMGILFLCLLGADIKGGCTPVWLFWGVWDLYSGAHTWMANILSTKPSFQLLCLKFWCVSVLSCVDYSSASLSCPPFF